MTAVFSGLLNMEPTWKSAQGKGEVNRVCAEEKQEPSHHTIFLFLLNYQRPLKACFTGYSICSFSARQSELFRPERSETWLSHGLILFRLFEYPATVSSAIWPTEGYLVSLFIFKQPLLSFMTSNPGRRKEDSLTMVPPPTMSGEYCGCMETPTAIDCA